MRGEQISGEYLHKKVLQDDGWFATNDAGWLDEDGYLFVEGRLDDVIVRGGENISPGEIEDVLREHPQVADVAVFGVPDDQWGEKVACALVRREAPPPADELAGWVQLAPALDQDAGGVELPRRAALQRHRQAAAPPAEGRDCPPRSPSRRPDRRLTPWRRASLAKRCCPI